MGKGRSESARPNSAKDQSSADTQEASLSKVKDESQPIPSKIIKKSKRGESPKIKPVSTILSSKLGNPSQNLGLGTTNLYK